MTQISHEQYEPEVAPPMPSERSTGLVFASVGLIVAFLWRESPTTLAVALACSGLMLITSLFAPSSLRPLNILWFKLALLLNKIVSPVVMLVLFIVVIVPFGIAMQLLRDPLRKRRDANASSYWINQNQKPPASNMSNQF